MTLCATKTEPNWGTSIPGGYFSRNPHCYRDENGALTVSVTKVFEILGLSDFSMVNEKDLNWKRTYGDAVHAATNFLVTGDLDWDSVDEGIIAPVTGIEQRLKDLKFELEAAEEPRVACMFGMKYGMTLDLRGTIEHQGRRRKAVIDIKTGSKFSQTWKWQLGGYLHPQEKSPLGWMGIVLQVTPEGRVIPHYALTSEVDALKREFQILLAAAILKLNHGFVTLRE